MSMTHFNVSQPVHHLTVIIVTYKHFWLLSEGINSAGASWLWWYEGILLCFSIKI